MTPEDIEALFRRTDGIVTPHEADLDEDEEVRVTEEEGAYRTARLREVLLAAQTAWVSGSEEIDVIAEKLGDGSRDPSWRRLIGDSGLLGFFLSIIANQDLRLPLKIHTLRLIGNSCADTDQNRALVLNANRLRDIINLLADDSILAFVIPVLYNILVDYEPAQLRACQAGLSNKLIGILSGPRLANCRAFINIICKTLALMITQEPEPKLASPVTPIVLLRVAADYNSPVDLEDFSLLASVALSYLSHEEFQSYLLTTEGPWLVLRVFADSYTRFGDLVSGLDPEEAAQLKNVQNAFVQVLSDLSALPNFLGFNGLNSPVVQTLQTWLRQPSYYTNLQTAACIALGNLARSDESSVAFVRDLQIHLPLIALLTNPHRSPTLSPSTVDSPPPSQLLHAILSFLKNLAIPAPNKPLLSPLLDPSILPRYWHLDTQPQTQFAAVSLTRLLLVGCPANVRRLCAPLSADPGSPAHDRSDLHVLTDLFDRVDAEPTKMEIARAVAAACRVLHSTPVLPILPEGWHAAEGRGEGFVFQPVASAKGGDGNSSASAPSASQQGPDAADPIVSPGVGRRARFYDAHADITRPLSFLIQQTRFPALRSEAWFVLALMSRSPEGARVVVRALQPFEACRALIEAITGRDMFDGHELLGGGAGAASSTSVSGGQDMMDSEFAAGMQRLRAAGGASGAGGGGVNADNAVEQLGLEPQQVDPARAANMAKVDRENGLVLVAEVLKDQVLDLTPFRRSMFEELLRTGGELVIHQRAEDKDTGAST